MGNSLLNLYVYLIGGVFLGVVLGRFAPAQAAAYLGNFLLWVGIPLSIVTFLRGANLSERIWLAPTVAWAAILLGAGVAWVWMRCRITKEVWRPSTQGSFLLTSMVGNTGYLGYPIVLALVGPKYFAWALFYDLLGTTIGAYGLGMAVAIYFGSQLQGNWLLQGLLKNPPLWSLFVGLYLRHVPLPLLIEQMLQVVAWAIIFSSLILIGMRLGQLTSWRQLPKACSSLLIKMVLIPFVIGTCLSLFGVTGPPRLALVLQMAMPPAFATLVMTEVYHLDHELTVTTLVAGSVSLLVLLPAWLWLF